MEGTLGEIILFTGNVGPDKFALPDLRDRMSVQQGTGPSLSPVELGEKKGSSTTRLTGQICLRIVIRVR